MLKIHKHGGKLISACMIRRHIECFFSYCLIYILSPFKCYVNLDVCTVQCIHGVIECLEDAQYMTLCDLVCLHFLGRKCLDFPPVVFIKIGFCLFDCTEPLQHSRTWWLLSWRLISISSTRCPEKHTLKLPLQHLWASTHDRKLDSGTRHVLYHCLPPVSLN